MKNGTIGVALAALVPAIAGAQMIVRPWSQTNEALEKRVAADCAGPCAWRMDGKKLKGNSCQAWWVLQAGQHALDVTCGGHRAALSFEVLP